MAGRYMSVLVGWCRRAGGRGRVHHALPGACVIERPAGSVVCLRVEKLCRSSDMGVHVVGAVVDVVVGVSVGVLVNVRA